jgi:hypothetical protein
LAISSSGLITPGQSLLLLLLGLCDLCSLPIGNVLRADLLERGRKRTQQKRPICPICPSCRISYMLKGNDYHPAPIEAPKRMKRAPIGTRHISDYLLDEQTKEQHPPCPSKHHACPECDSAFHYISPPNNDS